MESWHKNVIDGYLNEWNLVPDERHGCRPWWNVPLTDTYFRHNLVHHLGGAGFLDEMTTLVTRPFWIAKRVKKDSFALYANDIIFAIEQLNKFKNAQSREGIKAKELLIIKNALCLSHSFIFEDEAEIWFQLYCRLKEAAKQYEALNCYLDYIKQNAPRPFLCMEEPILLQASSGVDMLTIYDSPVSCISISEDGKVLLSGCESGLLSKGSIQDVFDISTQWTARQSYVSCVALSEDGKLGVSGANDGSVLIIETKRYKNLAEIENAHLAAVSDVSFCKIDPNKVLSCGKDGVICYWNVRSGENIWRVKEAHDGKVVTGICTMDEGLLVSSGDDGQIRFWDTKGSEEKEHRIDCGTSVLKLASSKNGRFLAAGLYDGTVRIWTMNEQGRISECFHITSGDISSLFLSPTGEFLAIGTKTGSSFVYNLKARKCIGKVERNLGSVTCISLIRVNDEDLCVWACERTGVRVHEINRYEAKDNTGSARAVCTSSDENEIVVAHEDGMIELIDLSSRTTRKSISTMRRLNVVQTFIDGNRLAYGCEDGFVGIWDLVNDKMTQEWKVHEGMVLSLAMSEDGKHMGSSGKDGTIRVWRLEYLECSPLLIETPQSDPLYSVFFGEESTCNMVTVSNREASLWNNYRVVKTSDLDVLMYFAGRYEAFQELGRELSVHKRMMVTLGNRLYVLGIDGIMSRVGGFEVDILPSCWAFSTLRNSVCVVGYDGIVRFGALFAEERCSE